jgi:hypothetical protein
MPWRPAGRNSCCRCWAVWCKGRAAAVGLPRAADERRLPPRHLDRRGDSPLPPRHPERSEDFPPRHLSGAKDLGRLRPSCSFENTSDPVSKNEHEGAEAPRSFAPLRMTGEEPSLRPGRRGGKMPPALPLPPPAYCLVRLVPFPHEHRSPTSQNPAGITAPAGLPSLAGPEPTSTTDPKPLAGEEPSPSSTDAVPDRGGSSAAVLPAAGDEPFDPDLPGDWDGPPPPTRTLPGTAPGFPLGSRFWWWRGCCSAPVWCLSLLASSSLTSRYPTSSTLHG